MNPPRPSQVVTDIFETSVLQKSPHWKPGPLSYYAGNPPTPSPQELQAPLTQKLL